MLEFSLAHALIIVVFVIGYLLIIFEHTARINKAASALILVGATWTILFLTESQNPSEHLLVLNDHLSNSAQIIFFLLGALTIVELIDSHKGFKAITDLLHTKSTKSLLWVIGTVTFFLSSILDNLTTTVVMVTLLKKFIPSRHERILLGSFIVIAANAGGAWTPIGDVTTTMLWINGNISSLAIMKSLFFPSLISFLTALLLIKKTLGKSKLSFTRPPQEKLEPGARLIFYLGLLGLIFVPIFKAITGLPPFIGILSVLGILWVATDLLHQKHEHRQHLLLQHTLTRIDTSGVLFFFGILLCVGSLDSMGVLHELADWLDQLVCHRLSAIAFAIGIISSAVDNVPLVAATMTMFDLQTHPIDSSLWQMLAYTAGTGGSILIVGSAAGVALMGLEKVDFLWYLRNVSRIAFLSYLSGFLFYLLQTALPG